MFAIVEIAGQQFKVQKDQQIFVNRLDAAVDAKVDFDQVLLIDNGGKIDVGAPIISGAKVSAKVLEQSNSYWVAPNEYICVMALFTLQVSLPDRPGSLGMLASAIGSAGADIRGLEVLKSEDGIGYDTITVAVPGTDPSDLVEILNSIGGVTVLSVEPLAS
jgi:ribosomal protein L21